MALIKLKNWDWVILSSVCLIIFLLGLLGGFLLYSYELNHGIKFILSPDINFDLDPLGLISTLISSVISIILAIYIVTTLTKREEEDRVERKLLIDHFNAFDSELIEKIRAFAAGGCSGTSIANVLKRYSMRMKELCELGVAHQLLEVNSTATSYLLEKIREVNLLLTDTPKTGAIEDGIRVEKEKLYYSASQTDKIARAVFDIRSAIFKVIVEINRAKH
jgi:hypothetical protein